MNWDNLEIDDTLTHDSRFYFANYKHQSMRGKRNDAEVLEDTESKSETTLRPQSFKVQTNERASTLNTRKSSRYSLRSVKCQNSNGVEKLNENVCAAIQITAENVSNVEETESSPVDQINVQMDNLAIPENKENEIAMPSNAVDNENKKANILTPSKWIQGAGAVHKGPQTPKAFKFHNFYQNKRKQALQKQLEEDRKMREFHSRPAPNFQQKTRSEKFHLVTVPETPQVLKRSKKRLEKLSEQNQNKQQRPEEEVEVLSPKPVRPYNLRCERRLLERKKFDEAIKRALEDKQKQEEEKQKKQEEEHIKELRKAMTFKARPNPFKNKYTF